MSNELEIELFDDLDIAEEKSSSGAKKEEIIDKVYQYSRITVNDKRGSYFINPVLDDKNKTVKKYNITSLVVYDDDNLKHFKDRDAFQKETSEYMRTKYVYTYSEYSKHIKDNNVASIRFTLPSIDSYDKTLLSKDGRSFLDSTHNELHSKLASNIKELWNNCDVFSQYFGSTVYTYFYGKIYKYSNLKDESLIENSKIVLFETKGKALPLEWTNSFHGLKDKFKDVDTGEIDKQAYTSYLKDLFSKELNKPKSKLIQMWFSKVSEHPKPTKNNANDNECNITHRDLNQPSVKPGGTLLESDFYYEAREKVGEEWVSKQERMELDLSNVVTLDYVKDGDTNRYTSVKFNSNLFDVDWYKIKIAESERLIKKYKINPTDTNIDDII